MPENLYATHARSTTGPLTRIFAITPGAPLPFVTRAIMVGTESTVKVVTIGGDTIVTLNLAPGVWHPLMVSDVLTGGTATLIHGGC